MMTFVLPNVTNCLAAQFKATLWMWLSKRAYTHVKHIVIKRKSYLKTFLPFLDLSLLCDISEQKNVLAHKIEGNEFPCLNTAAFGST